MREVRNAAADRLLGLTTVTGRLSRFRGLPAIFTQSPVPPSAAGIYIVIRDSFVDDPYETKQVDNTSTLGRFVAFDVGCYADAGEDEQTLEDLSRIVRDAFNRYQLPVSGYGTLIARATGPVMAPGDEEVDNQVEGRIVTVELTVIKAL